MILFNLYHSHAFCNYSLLLVNPSTPVFSQDPTMLGKGNSYVGVTEEEAEDGTWIMYNKTTSGLLLDSSKAEPTETFMCVILRLGI